MNCSELIDLYNKIGGTLICNYEDKKVKVLHTNLECEIKRNDYKPFERLLFNFGNSPYEVVHIKMLNNNLENIVNSTIKLENKFLKNDEIGYKIIFS